MVNMRGYAVFVSLLLVLMRGSEVEMMPEEMKKLATGFLKNLEFCKDKLGITDAILTDLYHLWKEEYDQVSRNAGCVLNCMSKQLNLLDEDGKVHHGNAKDFVLNHGGGEEVASQMVTLAHGCEKQQEAVSDECEYILEVAKCVRKGFKQLQGTPKMEVVMTEIVEDVGSNDGGA